MNKPKKKTRVTHMVFAMLMEELMTGACTSQQLSDYTGLGIDSTRKVVSALRARKVIHITGWEMNASNRPMIASYSLGQGADAQRPRKSRTQVVREYRARAAKAPLKGTAFYGLGA